MVELEADDALAAAAAVADRDARVERVIICTPDKDLAQCVRGTRIIQLNRRTRVTLDEPGVVKKFGVSPQSIRTIWRWWVILRMAIRACAAGVRSRRPLSLANMAISNQFLRIGANGM